MNEPSDRFNISESRPHSRRQCLGLLLSALPAGTLVDLAGCGPNVGPDEALEIVARNLAVVGIANPGFEAMSLAPWYMETFGTASASIETNVRGFGRRCVRIDARSASGWVSQGLYFRGATYYLVGAWVKSSGGASLVLQRTDTFVDFATVNHPGSGAWEQIFAVGRLPGTAPIPGRIKLQVAGGGLAFYDDVTLLSV